MFGFNEHKDAYDQVYNQENSTEHKGHFGHELLAGAASFAAMKKFQQEQRNKGEKVSHSFAKETIAAFAGAEAEKLAETKGLDAIEKEKLKHKAEEHANQSYDEYYGKNGDNWQPNDKI